MRIRSTLSRILSVLLLCSWNVSAQEETAVDIELSLHMWQSAQTGDDAIPTHSGIYYKDGEKFVELRLREGSRLDGIRYRGEASFHLFQPEQIAEEIVFRSIASVDLSRQWEKAFIYVFPKAKGYRLNAVDVSSLGATPGRFAIANFTGQPLGVRGPNQQVFTVAKGGVGVLNVSRIENFRLPLSIAIKEETGYRQVYSRITAVSPQGSYLAIVYELPESGHVRVFIERGVENKVEEEEEEEEVFECVACHKQFRSANQLRTRW